MNMLPLKVCQASTAVTFLILRRVQGTSCYQDMTKSLIFYIILVLTIVIYLFIFLFKIYIYIFFFRWLAFVWGL